MDLRTPEQISNALIDMDDELMAHDWEKASVDTYYIANLILRLIELMKDVTTLTKELKAVP